MTATDADYSDVLIIGAGISGIGAAYRIHEKNPGLSYTVLERRERIGGTWDLFRYPGIRSDSDIFTLSFPYEPWTRPENVADGHDIRAYLTDTARKNGIDEHIRFNTSRTVGPRPTAAGSCSSAPATTTTTSLTRRSSLASRTSPARSCIPNSGRSHWTTRANVWW
jgi:cation diffusion facilitator CzcD-associated flavoprotein CzcO